MLEAACIADWRGRMIVSGPGDGEHLVLPDLLSVASAVASPAATRPDDVCFWLYSSGSTGKPKGAVHVQTSLIQTAELFGRSVLGITEHDIIYSSAKLFFAYGLGNSLTFPMATGASSILHSAKVTPSTVNAILREQRPTIFCGVPTLFNAMLASPDLPRSGEHNLRLCISAGEALPEHLGHAWRERTGVDIVDGIGSTEMLHVFVSNRPGEVRYGSTGRPVPGYRVRLASENGVDVAPGEIGEMLVSGPTAAAGYWNNRQRTRSTFLGEWVRTGDKFLQTPDGDYVHCGRSDDMLKVSGNWVSPVEVEGALMGHEAVFEAGVIGVPDNDALIKPKAFVVLKPGVAADPALVRALQDFAATRVAPYKSPRWIEFVDTLPKTATGKLQRYLLHKVHNG
jgi:benzoate-CoA ligase